MALLNYISSSTQTIKDSLLTVLDKYLGINTTDADKQALIFTGDGHIITHGIDYYEIFKNVSSTVNTTYTFTNGTSGSFTVTPKGGQPLVISIGKPDNAGTADQVSNSLTIKIDNGKGLSNSVSTTTFNGSTATPISISLVGLNGLNLNDLIKSTDITTASDTKVYTSAMVDNKITAALTSSMTYKGSITKLSDIPTNPKIGDTYKIGKAGTYTINGNDVSLEVGDTIVTESKTINSSNQTVVTWTILLNNIDIASAKINGTSAGVYGTASWGIFAPTSAGTEGLVLMSTGLEAGNGKTPEWADVTPKLTYKNNLLEVSILGATSTPINVSTTNTLSVGVGLEFDTANATFNGSAARTVKLKIASTSDIGGIKLYNAKNSSAIDINTTLTNGHRYYDVKLDSNNKAYVDIPWLNTTYSTFKGASSTVDGTSGLVKKPIKGEHTYFLRGDGVWAELRRIYIGDKSIDEKAIKFTSGSNVQLVVDDSNNVAEMSYELLWYNLQTGKYEQ